MRAMLLPRENRSEVATSALGLELIPLASVEDAFAALGIEPALKRRRTR
jgi:hypothetical protein